MVVVKGNTWMLELNCAGEMRHGTGSRKNDGTTRLIVPCIIIQRLALEFITIQFKI